MNMQEKWANTEQAGSTYYVAIAQHDIAYKPRSRYGDAALRVDPNNNSCFVDWVQYPCPVRKVQAIAMQDVWGRYWTGLNWCEGGWVTRYEYYPDSDHSQKLGAKEDIAHEVDEDIPKHIWEVARDLHTELQGNHLQDVGEQPGDYVINYAVGARSQAHYVRMRGALIYLFDQEWGSGSYLISSRSAAFFHRKRLMAIRSRERQRATRIKMNAAFMGETDTGDER